MLGNAKGARLANGLNAIVRRDTGATISCVHSVTSGCNVGRSFCGAYSVRVRTPRTTVPGSNPSTKLTVAATLFSRLAKVPVHHSVTVANRVDLGNGTLPVNKLGRGDVTTCGTNYDRMVVPQGGIGSLARVSSRIGTTVRFGPISRFLSVLPLTLRDVPRRGGRGSSSVEGAVVGGSGSLERAVARWCRFWWDEVCHFVQCFVSTYNEQITKGYVYQTLRYKRGLTTWRIIWRGGSYPHRFHSQRGHCHWFLWY